MPEPLHPALVHFPIVLAALAPLLAAGLFFAIHTGRTNARAWVAVLIFQAAVAGSAWIAVETGENEEERVERVVAEKFIDEHHEAGERFLTLAALIVPVAAAGLLAGRAGLVARGLTVVMAVGAFGAAGIAGHSGGELVYKHGAAAAYVQPAGGAGSATSTGVDGDAEMDAEMDDNHEDDHFDHDRRDDDD